MNYIERKIRSFNKTFTKEEKRVIILVSIVTVLSAILGLWLIITAFVNLFNWYIDLTTPYVIKAMNNIIGFFFEGWTL